MSKDHKEDEWSRLTLNLGPKAFDCLEELEVVLENGSKSAVLREALQVYYLLIERAQKGYELCQRKEGEALTELLIPSVKTVQMRASSLRSS